MGGPDQFIIYDFPLAIQRFIMSYETTQYLLMHKDIINIVLLLFDSRYFQLNDRLLCFFFIDRL